MPEVNSRPEQTPVLDFHALDSDGTSTCFGSLHGSDAHDHWAIPRRLRELLACRDWADRRASQPRATTRAIPLTAMPRPEKNALSYLALAATQDATSVLELGSSLFELFDGLRAARSSLRDDVDVDISQLQYYGVEPSTFMRGLAQTLHPDIRLTQYADAAEAPKQFDFLYDRMVTSLAFQNTADCASFVNRARTGLLNLFVSREGTFASSWAGNALTYFDLADLLEQLDQPLYHLFGTKAPGADLSQGRDVIEGFFLSCSDETADRFQRLAREIPAVRQYCTSKSIALRPAETLLATVVR